MRSALVLNASCEPLSVVPSRRAACLILGGRADLVADDGTVLHSATTSLASPSVVRLRYMVRVPFQRRTTLSRRALFARDDHRCQYCGEFADSLDHIVPRSRGGQHTWENLAAACKPCNLRKRDRTPAEAGMVLARPPMAPRDHMWVTAAVALVPEEWKPYLAYAS